MEKNFITIILLSLLTINLTGCTSSNDSEINSAPLGDDYYVSIKSDYYDIKSGRKNGYIYTKNEEKVAKITYMNKDAGEQYVNLIKSSENMNILSVAVSESKNNSYYFYSKNTDATDDTDTNESTYNYVFLLSHNALLIEAVVPQEEAKEIPQKIKISEHKQIRSVYPYYGYYRYYYYSHLD